jgi:hypothetical protein
MKRSVVIAAIVLAVLIDIGATLKFKGYFLHTYNPKLTDKEYLGLKESLNRVEQVPLPAEPYVLTAEQQETANQCVKDELAADPQANEETDLKKYCECSSLFDESKFEGQSDSDAAAIYIHYTNACDDRHAKTKPVDE